MNEPMPPGTETVSYLFRVHNTNLPDNEVVFADSRHFRDLSIISGENLIWSNDRQLAELDLMMSRYWEDVNAAYPASAGFISVGQRIIRQAGVVLEGWPPVTPS